MPSLRSGRVPLLFGLVVSCVAVYYSLKDLQWGELLITIKGVDYFWFSLSCLLVSFGILFRGLRWCLIGSLVVKVPLIYARAVNMGVLANQLLPGRVGEVVRILAVVRLLPVGLANALGSAVLDRVIDVAVLIIVASLIAVTMANAVMPQSWLLYTFIVFLIVIGLLYMLRSGVIIRIFSALITSRLSRWAIEIGAFVTVFDELMRNLLQPLTFLKLFLLSIVLLAIDYLTVLTSLNCLGIEVPVEAPLILWVALAASSALPSAPGYVGVYQLAAVWSLGGYGVLPHKAVAVAFILQGAILFISILGSLTYFSNKLHSIYRK